MSNYPFDTFPLTKRVGIVNPVANLDARYGPWLTFNDALTGFQSALRHIGLTIAVSGVEGVVEYWFKNGTADSDLVLKISDIQPGDIIPTVTNYLSTNIVQISSLNINSNLTVVETISTTNYGNSQQWYETYTTVQNFSADWEETNEIIPTVTNYLSTNNVQILSANILTNLTVNNEISSQIINLQDVRFTGETTTAETITGDNLFLKIQVGNITKYLQLFDITLPATTYFVNFEDATKGSYNIPPTTRVLNGKTWDFTEALIGSLAEDFKFDLRSARLRGYSNSKLELLEDKPGGLGSISFFYRRFSSDSQIPWVVEYSLNQGTTWLTAGTFTADTTVQQFSAVINQPGPSRMRIRANTSLNLDSRRTNVDNILMTPFS